MSESKKLPPFRATFPLDDKLFEIACAAYRERGGKGLPNKEQSIEGPASGQRYTVLRNATGNHLATYRNDLILGPEGSLYNRLSDPEWPEPAYSLEPKDHIHALGAISANYTLLERVLVRLFLTYTKLPSLTGINLFSKLSNELRINTIRDALSESNHPDVVKEAVSHFLTGFMTIFNARNVLMHATLTAQPSFMGIADPLDIPIVLEKRSKNRPTEDQWYRPTLRELRAIADSGRAYYEYGSLVDTHIITKHEPHLLEAMLANIVDEPSRLRVRKEFEEHGSALPNKPPSPTPLNPRFP